MLQKTHMDAFLAEYWTPGKVEKLTYEHRPFLAMVPKNTKVGGENWVVPIDLDDGADGSPTFSDAQAIAAASQSQKRQFVVQYVEDFQLAQIENKIIRLTRDTPRLALEKAGRETERAQNILAQRIARNMYRSGYGDLGTLDAAAPTNVKTLLLSNRVDCRNFRIGQRITFAASLTAALRDTADYLTVVAIDFDNKKILTDAPTDIATSITGITAGDKIFLKGARGAGASPSLLTFQGAASWIPDTAPTTGDSFNGLDRSVWVDRLAGIRYPHVGTASGPIEDILIDALVDAAIREAYPTHLFLDPQKYGEALKALEGRTQKINEKVGKIGFNGFQLDIGYGSSGVKVFPDANCPALHGYALTLDTWEMGSAGELIQNDLQHGKGRDIENSSAVEYRYVNTGAFICKAPSKNQVIKFTA